MSRIGIIVPKESATLPGYQSGSIRADHRDIARYETAKDPGFDDVVSIPKRWVNSSVQNSFALREARLRFLHSLYFPGIEVRRAGIENPA